AEIAETLHRYKRHALEQAEIARQAQQLLAAQTMLQEAVAAQTISRIGAIDTSFEPAAFLGGAEGAFRMIVTAFAAGDRQTLRGLLSDDTYAGFEQAITGRENAGETQRTEIRAINAVSIDAAELRGALADITVRFVTDQVNMTTAKSGEVVSGSDAITELTDLWTFQRDVADKDPTWRLVATRSL
ncbi:MAG: Tim44 domain-containing protein, partial [Alphaproteobacteria bacterium]|nr:Tim44 domain-containing protein [Alphaproteobacteria bacterium]